MDSSSPKSAIQSSSQHKFKPNWLVIFTLIPAQLAGIILWPLYLILGGSVQWPEILIAFGMILLSYLGVNFGYHRGLSHLTFKMNKLLKVGVLVGGAATGESSALIWASDHRRHHRYQDTELDPYNIQRGFWWAHMGWMLGSPTTNDFSNSPDLSRDRWIHSQHRFYGIWFLVCALLLPMSIGALFDRALPALLLAGFTRLMVFHHITFFINSWAHTWGKRPFSKELTARDSTILAVLAAGEGYHNYHHRFPFDYRNGHHPFHWDPTKWAIYLFSKMGFTWDLKQTPAPEIFRARIQALQHPLKKATPELQKMTESLEATLAEWKRLAAQWRERQRMVGENRAHQIQELKIKLKNARREFKDSFGDWKIHLQAILRQAKAADEV